LQFVRVNQVFLNIMIGKAGLFNTVPVIGAPVAAELRKVERVFDVSITTTVKPWSYVFTDLEDRLLRSLLWTKSNLVRTI
jgi:hypothetical protein